MKLNLLPTSVAKSSGIWPSIVIGAVLALVGLLAAVGLTIFSNVALAKAKDEATSHQQGAADAVATAKQAETQMASSAVLIRNQALSEAMLTHNFKYTQLYEDVMGYIPGYYRITSMSAIPAGETTVVTLVGQLDTFSQYADLAIAMWKIPSVISVTRSGYQHDEMSVPNLTLENQIGQPLRPGETPIPYGDIEAQLQALQARAASAPSGFQNLSNFGSSDPFVTKGPMSGYSTVTMTVTMQRDIRTPDPRATLLSGGTAAGAAPGPFSPAPGAGGGPGAMPSGTLGATTGGGNTVSMPPGKSGGR